MEKINFYRHNVLKGSVHYKQGDQSVIHALESVYSNNEMHLGNQGLALQKL